MDFIEIQWKISSIWTNQSRLLKGHKIFLKGKMTTIVSLRTRKIKNFNGQMIIFMYLQEQIYNDQ